MLAKEAFSLDEPLFSIVCIYAEDAAAACMCICAKAFKTCFFGADGIIT
jgi:hypothetical protein